MGAISISLCMIVKNEEETLGRCLSSVKDAVDEIIIVDTGSDDKTKEIAAGFTDKLFDFEWINDFAAARNYSYERATKDFILWLDADDILLPEDLEKLKQLKDEFPPGVDAVMMKYNTGFDDNGKAVFSCFRERLSRGSGGFKWREPVHEFLEVGWKRINSDVCVTHAKPEGRRQNGRNLRIYEDTLARGVELSIRGMYYYARELKDNGRYADAIKRFELFLDSGKGWLEDKIAACNELALCYLTEKLPDEAINSLFRSFAFDTPRAETCCRIAYILKDKQTYRQAAFWFKLALEVGAPRESWGFRQEEYYGYVPCIELAVCYDKLGEYKMAVEFNERAGVFKPNSAAVLLNRKYFESRAE